MESILSSLISRSIKHTPAGFPLKGLSVNESTIYVSIPVICCFFQIGANVLPLAAVGDFGALHCQPSTNVDRSTALDLTTSAPLRQTAVSGSFSFRQFHL